MSSEQEHNERDFLEHPTARVEALSDGVFAIAVTLLILELKVPHGSEDNHALYAELRHLWPSYVAFFSSFITIAILWINHHRLFALIRAADHNLICLNALLLLGVTFVPFPTAVLAEYLGHPAEGAAAAFYSGTFVFIAIFYQLIWRYIYWNQRLIRHGANPHVLQTIDRQYYAGLAAYALLFLISFISVIGVVVGTMLLAVFFALPPLPLHRMLHRDGREM
jgi:uncharacterized membrane protein